MTIEKAFRELLEAEAALLKKEAEAKQIKWELDQDIALIERYVSQKQEELKKLMGDEKSILIEDELQNWKISYTKPRGKVKVTNIDAVPDELVKIEKKPMLKEIGAYLDEHGLSNWAEIETSEPKLTWRAVKKTINEAGISND